MNLELKAALLSLILLATSVGVCADEKLANPIIGKWDAGSRAFYGLKLEVMEKTITVGACQKVPYIIIKDQSGYGPGTVPKSPQEKWRQIVIELKPADDKQTSCVYNRVLSFSIPEDMQCHAQIAWFRSREDFDHSELYSWGVWGKVDCTNK
jgi:hypothetical protein